MIRVDISNIWGEVSLPDLLSLEREVFEAHNLLTEGTGAGSELRGWLELPAQMSTDELIRIRNVADRIRANSDVLVVIGAGGSYLGSRAAIELLQGVNHNIGKGKGNPQIFFAGFSLSTRHWNELLRLLEGKDYSIVAISKSGSTLEPAIAMRALRWMLERKYGTDEARRRIYTITDPTEGVLRQMTAEAGWETFSIPADVSSRFSVLTAAGLLPMAVAGIDIMAMVSGAADAKAEYDLRSFENPVWLYTAIRQLMHRQGKAMEILAGFDPCFKAFGAWWQHMFGQSEGKDGKGLFPVFAEFTTDLHTFGQTLQQGQRNFFETMLRFDAPALKHIIGPDYNDPDGLNYLSGKTLDYVDEQAYLGTLDAHVDGGVPVITVECGSLNAANIGELFYFFQLSAAISAYMLGVNPFDQPGAEAYQRNMYQLLGRPENADCAPVNDT